jgi:peptidoglycan/LPS O-acetylase OafA/YrhL
MPSHIPALDYARGLFALSVLAFHFYGLGGWVVPGLVDGCLRKAGIYAVAAFFVISGLSLGYAYRDLPLCARPIAAFWVKRFFRLWPVYALATIATVLVAGAGPGRLGWLTNLTLTFGLVMPQAAVPFGGWSIGDEVVFYVFFPLLLFARQRDTRVFVLLLAATVALAAGMPASRSTRRAR